MAVPHSLAQPLRDRAETLAHRLLAGAGLASLVAYRIDAEQSVDVLAHGLTSTGALVVAVPVDALPEGHMHDVRVDVRREATEASVRITSASLHLLGQLVWLTHEEVADLPNDAALPWTTTVLVGSRAVRWARVACERVVLHDASGVRPFTFGRASAARATFPAPSQEVEAQEVVLSTAAGELAAICEGVRDGSLAGRVQSERPSQGVCDHTAERVYCVDVDGLGVNLMHVGRQRTTVVFAPFDVEVSDLRTLAGQVAVLATRAGRAASRETQRGW